MKTTVQLSLASSTNPQMYITPKKEKEKKNQKRTQPIGQLLRILNRKKHGKDGTPRRPPLCCAAANVAEEEKISLRTIAYVANLKPSADAKIIFFRRS
jgi:hypothetical protein